MNKIGYKSSKIIFLLIILWILMQTVESSNCLSSNYSNRKCLNISTCVNITGEEPWCACDLPFNGTNCEQCLCFLINQTCSIYGDSICKLKYYNGDTYGDTFHETIIILTWTFYILVPLGVICFIGGCFFRLFFCFFMCKSMWNRKKTPAPLF